MRWTLVAASALAFAACGVESPGPSVSPGVPVAAAGHDRQARPRALAGLDAVAVRDMLGEPEFVWRQPGAAMWRYRARACLVDVFLYDGDGVAHVEIRGEGLDEEDRSACLRRLLETRSAPGIGAG